MKIIVDADACPVKEIIFAVAQDYHLRVALVCSIAHVMPDNKNADIYWVERESQAADIAIINLAEPGDIIVTGDYGLASIVLGKKTHVISFRGHIYREYEMDSMLESRYQSQKIRQAGGRTKGPKPFIDKDRNHFEQNLLKLLESSREE